MNRKTWNGRAAMFGLSGLLFGLGAAHVPARAQSAVAAPMETYAVTLKYTPAEPAETVNLAGTFNGWNSTALPMTKAADGRTWQVTLNLEPDIYQYKFVVNGKTWVPDPNAPKMDDGQGNTNSLLTVAPAGFDKKPAKTGDGIITESAIRHDVSANYVMRLDKTHVALTLRTRHYDVEGVTIENAAGDVQMKWFRGDTLFDYWRGDVQISEEKPLKYDFAVRDAKFVTVYGAGGNASAARRPHSADFLLYPADFPEFITPDWARDAVFYQIFPERFANGDTRNDPADVQPWGTKPTFNNWMGGDLRGVINHFDYLRGLGINALYFNPLFAARSNHAYDTTDYRKIDPRFGTNAELKELTTKAHGEKWHVILDGVFNHTGVDFAPFKSLLTDGAKSPYKDWYYVRSFPLVVKDGQQTYNGWYGSPWMPKMNVLNAATRDYLLGTAKYWITEGGIDGWRLDAADEVNPELWRQLRKAVRSVKSDAYIVGEHWGDSSAWLHGDQWDSAMNYPWCFAVQDFFAKGVSSPSAFDARLRRIREDYPPSATAVMFNILDSHDTERIRTVCGGSLAKEEQAVLFQMTYPGAPVVYYGDELGMEGGKDPDNRRATDWKLADTNNATLAFYKKAIALRNATPCLRRGDFVTAIADDKTGVYAFTRTLGEESALVVFNRSDTTQTVVLDKKTAQYTRVLFASENALAQPGSGKGMELPPRGMMLLGNNGIHAAPGPYRF